MKSRGRITIICSLLCVAVHAAEEKKTDPIWLSDLPSAYQQAQKQRQPILVIVGGPACPWCRKLDVELENQNVKKELARWTLVHLDVSKAADQARDLGVSGIPALRVLSSAGDTIELHDGYLPAEQLVEWLQNAHKSAASNPADDFTAASQPSEAAAQKLVSQLNERDPARREAAIRRLMRVPQIAAGLVVQAFADDKLALRLAALELLAEWRAPLDGIDPWQPDTITPERLSNLKQWAAGPHEPVTSRPTELTSVELEYVRSEIKRLAATDRLPEAQAIRERLARWGTVVMPEVLAALSHTGDERVQERLTALRYRLVASDRLILQWTGGLERLASNRGQIRQQAAAELAQRATAEETQLVLELFSNSDPLVREIALRVLQQVGGNKASEALVGLLNDPDSNVRAAVLKQLAEKPSRAMVPKVAAYVATETDTDLIGHAVRYLRAACGTAAVDCLMKLLEDTHWQVRAEVVEALGDCVNSNDLNTERKANVYAALLRRLEDSDGFVVGRTVAALKNVELIAAVEPLMKAASDHPEIAGEVLTVLSNNNTLKMHAVPHLRNFCLDGRPNVRAAAITALSSAVPDGAKDEIVACLSDPSSIVRIAAARALFTIMESSRSSHDQQNASRSTVYYSSNVVSTRPAGLFGKLAFSLITGRQYPNSRPASRPEQVSSQPASATQPAASKPAEEIEWTQQFRMGKRPKWMNLTIEPLEKMLQGAADEVLVAAVCLIPLGKDEEALPILQAAAQQGSTEIAEASKILPWLPYEQRVLLYEQFSSVDAGRESLGMIAQSLADSHDARAPNLLWSILARNDIKEDVAGVVLQSLRQNYFGDNYYNISAITARQKQQAIDAAKSKLDSGPELQRVVALMLLANVSSDQAAEAARKWRDDPASSNTLRQDAFHILIVTLPKKDARRAALEALTEADDAIVKIALACLSEAGANELSIIRKQMYLMTENNNLFNVHSSTGQPILPSAPPGLKPEPLRPLLQKTDREVVAYAGYLLTLLGDRQGLEALLAYYRERPKEGGWRKLAYRAIVASQDDSLAGTLEEIYRTFQAGDYELREFYWTIRSMSGEKMLALRKTVRDQTGMQNLR